MDAIVLADSINSATQDRLTTFLLPRFPKCLQAELRTHRTTSQSHYSSRAIPVQKVIEQVKKNPFIPKWTQHKKGMSGEDILSNVDKTRLTREWLIGRDFAIHVATNLFLLGCAKQETNRILEPWMKGPCVVTATQKAWSHFFSLRTVEGVQPDFRSIAQVMQKLYDSNQPQLLQPGEWHIPWVDRHVDSSLDLLSKLKISAARSARTSYFNHEGDFSIEKDFDLHDRLIFDKHSTPCEHQGKAMDEPGMYRNFQGWMHYRQHIEEGFAV